MSYWLRYWPFFKAETVIYFAFASFGIADRIS